MFSKIEYAEDKQNKRHQASHKNCQNHKPPRYIILWKSSDIKSSSIAQIGKQKVERNSREVVEHVNNNWIQNIIGFFIDKSKQTTQNKRKDELINVLMHQRKT